MISRIFFSLCTDTGNYCYGRNSRRPLDLFQSWSHLSL